FKGITLTGFWLQKALNSMDRSAIEQLYQTLSDRLVSKQLSVGIEATYPIERIREAVGHAGRSHRHGKVLVLPNSNEGN
ncbi:MAG: hypothetical protein AAFO01_09795, partial [Pseudomonadota bacterium]